MVVPGFAMVPDLLRGSDHVAMLPSRVLRHAAALIAALPVDGAA